MNDEKTEVSEQAVDALANALGNRLVAVVLFGSRARGDARPWSDWDLLVIAEGLPENPFDRQMFINRVLFGKCDGGVSVVARSPQEFESHVSSLYLDIALDGRVLYDPAGYVAERLATLRRLIEEAGLYRERTPAGDIWQWKKRPHGAWVMSWEKIGELHES
jgi:predicted nucleotidyltransferase